MSSEPGPLGEVLSHVVKSFPQNRNILSLKQECHEAQQATETDKDR